MDIDLAAAPSEGQALLAALDLAEAGTPTACTGWTAHDLVAHLAAGAGEMADLMEDAVAGRPVRPTRPFDEREAPLLASPWPVVRSSLVTESLRAMAAVDALRHAGATVAFTGATLTADEVQLHMRSEAALHHWDLVGDDPVSDRLLAQPELTAHAVSVLNRMPVLQESARALGERLATSLGGPVRVALRSPDRPDVVLHASAHGGRFELGTAPDGCEIVVTTDPAHRLLMLWGRRTPWA